MVESGFLAPRPMRPGTIGIVILGHAAVLAAVILAKSPIVQHLPKVTTVEWIKEPPAPPPEPPPPARPQPDVKRPTQVDRPTPIVQPEDTLTRVNFVNLGKVDPLPPIGTIDPPQPPLPPRPVAIVDAQPVPGVGFQPAYPPALQRAEVEGRATVRVLVGTDGRVHAVEIVAADDPAFGEATRRQALRGWRFRPVTRDGVAVESWRTLTVHFRMQA